MDGLKRALRARFAGGVDVAAAGSIGWRFGPRRRKWKTLTTETEARDRLTSTATVVTPKAAGYAAQLAKHFAHKLPARFEDGDGEIAFPAGTCRLHAEGDRLTLTVDGATPEAIATLRDVVARHLLRFAFREELAIDWS